MRTRQLYRHRTLWLLAAWLLFGAAFLIAGCGAGVTLWISIMNPNPFGFTLSTLNTTLLLEGQHAATGDVPLGLPLGAGQESVVPIDLTISVADLPGLAGVIRQAATCVLRRACDAGGTPPDELFSWRRRKSWSESISQSPQRCNTWNAR
jgi:hypothetical protein